MQSFAPWARARRVVRAAAVVVALAACAAAASAADDVQAATEVFRKLEAELRVTDMTFVGGRGDTGQFVLRASRAVFHPETQRATLEDVRIVSTEHQPQTGPGFEVSCERGELDIATNDFFAEGDVQGTTGDGRRYKAPWVRYQHAKALLYTDAPVEMQDKTGTFRGDGFRYLVKERRFRLLGNVSLVQAP
jgi:LPS export ABC transporter protein LptC